MATSTRTLAAIVIPRPLTPARALVRDGLLIIGGAALIAGAAQASIPLQPVPITLQTLAVLLIGAAYGWRRGALTLVAYVLAGAAGLPIFANHRAGLTVLAGPTGGYLIGFILAATLVGYMAEHGWDRTPWLTALAMLLGTIIIYAIGLPWLATVLHFNANQTYLAGLQPFIAGDAVKLAIAVVLLPAAHLVLRRFGGMTEQ